MAREYDLELSRARKFGIHEAPGDGLRKFRISEPPGEGLRKFRFSEPPGDGLRKVRSSARERANKFVESVRHQGMAGENLDFVSLPGDGWRKFRFSEPPREWLEKKKIW